MSTYRKDDDLTAHSSITIKVFLWTDLDEDVAAVVAAVASGGRASGQVAPSCPELLTKNENEM